MKKIISFIVFLSLLVSILKANNVSVNNVKLTGQNTIKHSYQVKFDVGWDNSWSDGVSKWDAVWVFVKYRKTSDPIWKHSTLNFIDGHGPNDGHSVPTGSLIHSAQDVPGGSHGVFICADHSILQSVNYTNAELQWNYGVDGELDTDSFEICVFAIEMVRIPQGSFEIGGSGSWAFFNASNGSGPITINSSMSNLIKSHPGSYPNYNPDDSQIEVNGIKIDGN